MISLHIISQDEIDDLVLSSKLHENQVQCSKKKLSTIIHNHFENNQTDKPIKEVSNEILTDIEELLKKR